MVLEAAADAGATPIVVTAGAAAGRRTAAGGGGLFGGLGGAGGSGGGAGSGGRIAALAQRAGCSDYVVISAAGLDPAGPASTPLCLVLAEAGTVDAATAGAVGVADVATALSALLTAPSIPAGPVLLTAAGSSVDAGDLAGQLATALSSIEERNAAAAAEAAAKAEAEAPVQEEAPEVTPPRSQLFAGLGTIKLPVRAAQCCACVIVIVIAVATAFAAACRLVAIPDVFCQ